MADPIFVLASPNLQIGFAHRLAELQQTHLQVGLLKAVADLDITALDKQLAVLMPAAALQKLASLGMRGELLFAAPIVLKACPSLLTYYRTLLGYSQKEFYKTGSGLGVFRRAEDASVWGTDALQQLPALCACLNVRAWELLQGVDRLAVSPQFLNELSLLSIGPQLRGGSNNARGEAGIEEVFKLILTAIGHAKPMVLEKAATFDNAAGRQVIIEIAADPDVVIKEKSPGHGDRPLLAIEVKAGTDVSNIHNRIGEAEKSHLKAKARKFTECWTIVNVPSLDMEMAAQQSPTTHRFFKLSELSDRTSKAHSDFVASIVALVGIKSHLKAAARSKKR